MEESIRRSNDKIKKNSFCSLPPLISSDRPLKQVLNTENAFKLCRVGVNKTKFINFDLRYVQNQNQTIPSQQKIKIPLMIYNRNRFSPYKQSIGKKNPHLLLVSRVKNQETLPSVSVKRHAHKSLSSAKFRKEADLVELGIGKEVFIT